jgi:nucleoid-associated protein YgaU
MPGAARASDAPGIAEAPAAPLQQTAAVDTSRSDAVARPAIAEEAKKEEPKREDTKKEAPAEAELRFDVVRVEPTGEIVTAGRAAPGATVDLLLDGRKYDRVVADLNGQWAIVPAALSPGTHELSLRMKTPEGRNEVSTQSLTVVIPASRQTAAVVTLNEPDKATAVLQGTEPSPGQPSTGDARRAGVTIATAESEDVGRFYSSGAAAPGAIIRLYVNDAYIATAKADPAGRWSFTVEKGMVPGRYDIRVDEVDTATGRVLSRAAVVFDLAARPAAAMAARPSEPAPTPRATERLAATPPANVPLAAARPQGAPSEPAIASVVVPVRPAPVEARPAPAPSVAVPRVEPPASIPQQPIVLPVAPPVVDPAPIKQPVEPRVDLPAPIASDVVIPEIRSTMVRRGDSLWRISRRVYGQGVRYTAIFQANTDQIRDPARIYPGQVFVVPSEADKGFGN